HRGGLALLLLRAPLVQDEVRAVELRAAAQVLVAERGAEQVLQPARQRDVARADAAAERRELGGLRCEAQHRLVDGERVRQVRRAERDAARLRGAARGGAAVP